ncbi:MULTISPECIES: phosphate ABC transporter permease subunit PstC [Sphingomonas]|jgi:phosphate transport system permease protein|uniref:Phosphate transport system permease protein n=1 Tax=Sphingomonas zeae TaxID=1646122 RepID=A0A7Y6B597_9SPHN|nr:MULTISPECIES: phosphate ABC transporter permease subunit PstC [Sphingomonas]MBB4047647.1 phosphate transport system permease protein [Sphingomonas zeae]MDK8185624.1 phosphate ABC transporter permease subunit PstC [Sphingomonas zeae]MDK8216645.1 phosphate ABC transporter permease subunit PstC [Sphingomonas sp. UMB7805-LC452B]NUU47684.1 phosphate ABC transporter permease subunit PstC [Sphingomonas zeae]
MNGVVLLILTIGLGIIAWAATRMHALSFRRRSGTRASSLPHHHGWYVALWTTVPPLVFLAIWTATSPALVTDMVLKAPAAAQLPPTGFERGAILSEARALAAGQAHGAFHALSRSLTPAYDAAQTRIDWIATAIVLLLALAGGAYAYLQVRPEFSARTRIERVVLGLLLSASLIAIFTTAGIVASLLYEAGRFFSVVPITDFLFGTHWSPQSIDPRDPGASLGAVPLFWGTFFIGAIIAMAVAIPFGLMSAVYLTQYAAPRARRIMKPVLEVLAGVPTVVYGYFAALTVAPTVRQFAVAIGIDWASSESALAAGLVMGVMIIPFVSSMADDSLAAVPSSMRDGSLAMGATPSETITRVMLPAALPGVVGGVLLAVSRAIGETMIVVMAASGVATLTANPFASTTTVTRQIVDLLTGEAEFDSPKTLAAFALGLTLFIITLLLNIVALNVVKRYRETYE